MGWVEADAFSPKVRPWSGLTSLTPGQAAYRYAREEEVEASRQLIDNSSGYNPIGLCSLPDHAGLVFAEYEVSRQRSVYGQVRCDQGS
jgi:hypothetical protein